MNHRLDKDRNRGLSVAELLVASVVALLLLGVMFGLLRQGIGAHEKGSQSRRCQAGVRRVMAILTAELRSSSTPPLSSPTADSPVFWPSVWGSQQEVSDFGRFYPREQTPLDNGDEWDRATNRFFFVRRSDDSPAPNDPLSSHVLVEFLVSESNPGALERRVHPLTSDQGFLIRQSIEGADGRPRQAWLLSSGDLPSAPDEPEVVFDAGPESQVAFRIAHQTHKPSGDPGRTRFPQLFEPGVFRIEVSVSMGKTQPEAVLLPWAKAEDWETYRTEDTEIRIPSVRAKS